MQRLEPNSGGGAPEKHVPEVTVDGDKVTVTVGGIEHPMPEAHYIAWMALQTVGGRQRKPLLITGAPRAEFALADGDKAVAAYEYCNLHGLWKKEI
jgi:superoxide reductase